MQFWHRKPLSRSNLRRKPCILLVENLELILTVEAHLTIGFQKGIERYFDGGVAMLTRTKTRGPVHLRFDGSTVYITPKDSGRFRMTAKRAIETLKKRRELDKMLRRFEEEYLPRLHSWCQKNSSRIQSCYLWVPNQHGLTVVVVGASGKYDFELGDMISQFAIELEQERWPSNVLQVVASGPEEIHTYFDPETSLQVYAKTEAASGKS